MAPALASETKPAAERLVSVILEKSTWVVERGVEHRTWKIKRRGVWLRPEQIPGVASDPAREDPEDGSTEYGEFLVRPAGCQYLCRYHVMLPVGTELERLVSKPRNPSEVPRDDTILDWLRYSHPPRVTKVVKMRVSRTGRLVSATRFERMQARGATRRGEGRERHEHRVSAEEIARFREQLKARS